MELDSLTLFEDHSVTSFLDAELLVMVRLSVFLRLVDSTFMMFVAVGGTPHTMGIKNPSLQADEHESDSLFLYISGSTFVNCLRFLCSEVVPRYTCIRFSKISIKQKINVVRIITILRAAVHSLQGLKKYLPF